MAARGKKQVHRAAEEARQELSADQSGPAVTQRGPMSELLPELQDQTQPGAVPQGMTYILHNYLI